MSFLAKLKTGLSKTSGKLGGGIADIFTKRKLDAASLEALEELLIEADMGAQLAAELTQKFSKQRFDKEISPDEVREFLAGEIATILAPFAVPLFSSPLEGEDQGGGYAAGAGASVESTPHPTFPLRGGRLSVVVMVGVNGNGKTTTIGKLAAKYKAEGKKVMLAAADTFRAAAVEQLQVWGERSDIPVVTGAFESDPASVAFNAFEKAKAEGVDILFIDTAGRLQNKTNLMGELQKILKVLKKIDEAAPHHIIQVLDATTGQNALSQVAAFKEMVHVSGLIITKLDGTAKGGIVVALARQSGLPIHAIGIGEKINDLDSFNPIDFARNLLDLR